MSDEFIYLDDQHQAHIRLTPWNDAVFNISTSEIIKVYYQNQSNLMKLLDKIDQYHLHQQIDFTCFRTDLSDKILLNILQNQDFYVAEVVYRIKCRLQSRFDASYWSIGDLKLEEATVEDLSELEEIVKTNFHHGRFFEDIHFPRELSAARNAAWVRSAFAQGKSCTVYRSEGAIRVMFLTETAGNKLEILLGGSRKGSDLFMPRFVASCLNQYRRSGLQLAQTTVSVANLGMINAFAGLKSKFAMALAGMHKWYSLPPAHWRKASQCKT